MDMVEKNKQIMLGKKVWVVLGVTPKTKKFGYQIWKKLKDNDYTVYAINPKYDEIEGEKCYDSIKDLPEVPEVVNFVVPPAVSMKYVNEANELGIEYLWFQPGTADEEVLDKAEELKMNIAFLECVLVELDK